MGTETDEDRGDAIYAAVRPAVARLSTPAGGVASVAIGGEKEGETSEGKEEEGRKREAKQG